MSANPNFVSISYIDTFPEIDKFHAVTTATFAKPLFVKLRGQDSFDFNHAC